MRITLQYLFGNVTWLEAVSSFVQWSDPEERQFAYNVIFSVCYHYYATLNWHRVTQVLEYSRIWQ